MCVCVCVCVTEAVSSGGCVLKGNKRRKKTSGEIEPVSMK